MKTPHERLMERVAVQANGCWEWTGKTKENGYGQFMVAKRYVHVHRFAYQHYRGPIPGGLTIDHLCRNRACVNPEHLEAVTQRVNVLRGESICAKRAKQTHCKHGHPLTPANTYIKPNGIRNCRTCRRESASRSRQRKAAKT